MFWQFYVFGGNTQEINDICFGIYFGKYFVFDANGLKNDNLWFMVNIW